TSWIRVMTPDAGSSSNVPTNRGFVFIPEEGDQVLLGFRYNDPNRPFVLGSLFNGQTAAGGLEQNKSKSITTRSGNTITFNDDENQGKITISDPSGSSITLNGDETITISAPKTITLGATNIFLNGTEIELKGTNVKIGGKENIVADAPTVGITGTKSLSLLSSKNATINGGAETNVFGDAITTNSTGDINITGPIVKINS
ncbi:phage baseplate assembly protein V, partial [Cellulophaga lytica]|uniref:phage baseplate assembly protein V n=1 Tax=Cellulophaga lytica TaxID=979 RepID=UPI0020164478